jgi:hypothetical protein
MRNGNEEEFEEGRNREDSIWGSDDDNWKFHFFFFFFLNLKSDSDKKKLSKNKLFNENYDLYSFLYILFFYYKTPLKIFIYKNFFSKLHQKWINLFNWVLKI